MAAENADRRAVAPGERQASMRPRRMAAENSRPACTRTPTSSGFNEAAAHGRGKYLPLAERLHPAAGFNEAAAHGRGKSTGPVTTAEWLRLQ